MEDNARIKVVTVDKLEKNMRIDVVTSKGETKSGYFKKFMVKENGKNIYRSSVEELPDKEDVYLFFTDQEQDQIVQGNAKTFVKSDSVPVKQIKELYIVPPGAIAPWIGKLTKDIKDLKNVVRQQQQ